MNRPLPGPVLRYLRELEPLVKARVGVFVEQVLSDAREYLVNDYDALATSEPGLDDETVYHHFVQNFGTPLQTASQYGEEHGVRRGNAPGWRICCTRCGKSAPATEVGITKIGARSYHSYKMCHCSHCRRLRWARLIRDLNDTNLTDRLAMGQTPERVISRMHRPWTVVAAILLLVAIVDISVPLLVRWLIHSDEGPAVSEAMSEPGLAGTVKPVALIEDKFHFKDLPDNWRLVKTVSIPNGQLSSFSQKLGVRLKRIENHFLNYRDTPVQVNEIECDGPQAAAALVHSLRKSKSNPRLVCGTDKFVFELVARDKEQIKAALRARIELGLIPSEALYEVSFSAAPVTEADAAEANRMFNSFIALDGGDESAAKDIEARKSSFAFGNRISLSFFGQGEVPSSWSFTPAAANLKEDRDSSIFAAQFRDLPTKVGIPIVNVQGKISSQSYATSQCSPEAAAACLKSTKRWPVDSPRIQNLAAEITAACSTPEAKLEKLLNWMGNETNFRFGGDVIGSRYGTLQALDQGYGHCWDYSDVFITLARASGIPARQVHGWLFESEGHIWPEVAMEGKWIAIDPSVGLRCGSDYIPFSKSIDGETSFIFASLVKLRRL